MLTMDNTGAAHTMEATVVYNDGLSIGGVRIGKRLISAQELMMSAWNLELHCSLAVRNEVYATLFNGENSEKRSAIFFGILFMEYYLPMEQWEMDMGDSDACIQVLWDMTAISLLRRLKAQ